MRPQTGVPWLLQAHATCGCQRLHRNILACARLPTAAQIHGLQRIAHLPRLVPDRVVAAADPQPPLKVRAPADHAAVGPQSAGVAAAGREGGGVYTCAQSVRNERGRMRLSERSG